MGAAEDESPPSPTSMPVQALRKITNRAATSRSFIPIHL
jgi:hypothetical protein